MKMTVLYAGGSNPHAGWAAIDEMALLLTRLFDAELLSPALLPNNAIRRLLGRHKVQFAPVDSQGGDVLFVVARGPEDLAMINAIPDARKRFSQVHAFVTDSYFHAGYYAETELFDSITVTAAEDIAFPRRTFGIQVYHLHQGTDGLRWVDRHSAQRSIDVVSYGRTPSTYHAALVRRFHSMASAPLYLHSPLGHLSGPSVAVERNMLFKVLHRTRISLAFNLLVEPEGGRPRSMMVTSRWLESLLSGTVVAGRRPVSRMAEEMLDWDGCTVELSDHAEEAVDQIQALLADPEALERQGRINTLCTLQRHDWRHRIRTLCDVHGWEPPAALLAELHAIEEFVNSRA